MDVVRAEEFKNKFRAAFENYMITCDACDSALVQVKEHDTPEAWELLRHAIEVQYRYCKILYRASAQGKNQILAAHDEIKKQDGLKPIAEELLRMAGMAELYEMYFDALISRLKQASYRSGKDSIPYIAQVFRENRDFASKLASSVSILEQGLGRLFPPATFNNLAVQFTVAGLITALASVGYHIDQKYLLWIFAGFVAGLQFLDKSELVIRRSQKTIEISRRIGLPV